MIDNPAGRAEARPSAFASANDPAGARSYIVYFVAGERSGDNHGAALLKAVQQLAAEGALPVNVRFACDGEEEIGGSTIVDFIVADEGPADACVEDAISRPWWAANARHCRR